ncbi:stress-related protein [Apium graveolens]|uniref:stress-related protein n=1 Tax=Apium graveolens TaxID=4045 RepID=UPI003D7A352A
MAETDLQPPAQSVKVDDKKLKYLNFVQVVAIYVIVLFSSIYKYAKGNAGPLKSGIQTVEGAVKAVTGPVYHKFHNVPFQLLVFVDHKVDELMTEIDHHTPSLIKEASTLARAIALDVKRAGVVETATNVAKTV